MATKAGQIVINIRAGTKSLKSDLKEGSDQFNKFGREGVTGVQAVSATLRVLEGNVTNNLRAAERFLANTLKLGPILRSAFPVVGAIAFGGVIVEMGKRVAEFYKEVAQGPEKMRGTFADLNASLRVTNDGLLVSNARLKNEIAQIQGLPQNNLKVALLEAKEAADKLNESLTRGVGSAAKLISEQSGSWFHRAFAGLVGNQADFKDISKELGGATGQYGGFSEKIRGKSGKELADLYTAEIQKFQQQITLAQHEQERAASGKPTYGGSDFAGNLVTGNMSTRLEILKGELFELQQAQKQIQLTGENSGLNTKKAGLEDKKASELLDRPFENKLKALQAELEGTREKFEGVGTAAGEVMGSGLAKAAEDIAAVNKGLEKRGPLDQMNALQALQIIFTDTAIAAAQAENAWNKEFVKTTDTIKDRISAQERLNAVIGGTYAQRKSAFVENALPGAIGAEHANDPAWMAAHPDQVAAVRGQLGQEFAGQESNKNKSSLQELADKIRLTSALAAAERDGAAAVREVELAEKIRVATRGMDAASAAELTTEMRALYAEENRERNTKALAELKEKADAMDRLAGAYGRQARLQAEAQNAYDKTYKETGSPEVAASAAAEVLRKDQDEITIKAHEMATAYSDQMEVLKQTDAILKGIVGTEGARREVEQQILELEIKHDLQEESARAGLNAYFLEMQHQAKTTAEIVYDALTQATDKVTNDLANMATGKRPKGGYGQMFGKTFQDIGHGLVQSTLKSGIGKIMGHFGLGGKPDGSSTNPFHVVMGGGVNLPGGNAVPGALGGLLNKLPGAGGTFGGGMLNAAGTIFSALPGLAEGATDVYPGSSYVVGDGGEPEVFTPKTSGSVTPAHKIGGTNYNITVHAPNAEIGAENRIYEAVTIAHHAAVSDSVRADHELAARRPQRSKH